MDTDRTHIGNIGEPFERAFYHTVYDMFMGMDESEFEFTAVRYMAAAMQNPRKDREQLRLIGLAFDNAMIHRTEDVVSQRA